MDIYINTLTPQDWPAVKRIYEYGIQTGNATFQTSAPDVWEEWSAGKNPACQLGAQVGSTLAGWATVSYTSSRICYCGIGEVSIYTDPVYARQGIGAKLMAALIQTAEEQGFWTLQASIFPENAASVHLHQKYGFRLVGRREKIARMEYGPYAGKWRDTLWFERRSQIVGIV